MFETLYDKSALQFAATLCIVFVGFTWFGIIFIRPIIRAFVRSQGEFNGILSSFLSIYGLFYGILMGLLAVAAFQNKLDVEKSIADECTSMFAMFRIVSTYPEPHRTKLQTALRDYCQNVVEQEWPAMREGRIPRGVNPMITSLQKDMAAFQPQNETQKIFHQEVVRQYFRFLELRAQRLYNTTAHIPGIMWYVVLLGALLTIIMMWLFEMKLIVHFLLSGLLSFFIANVIGLVALLDRPLRGPFGIAPEGFQLLYDAMGNLMSAG